MSVLNCIIVDDDSFSTKIMSSFIGRTESVTLEKVFVSAIDAVNYLSRPESVNVDLIFLDIEMPEMSGIEFMRSVDLTDKEVVIYSSQEKYALESYEYDVCDYLLKPVTYARFIKAIGKVRAALELKNGDPTKANQVDSEKTIFLKDNNGKVYKVAYEDIIYVEAMENYVSVVLVGQKLCIHIPMKKLMDVIPEEYVIRTHRSYAVGLKYIKQANQDSIEVEYGGESRSFIVSRTYRAEVKRVINSSVSWNE